MKKYIRIYSLLTALVVWAVGNLLKGSGFRWLFSFLAGLLLLSFAGYWLFHGLRLLSRKIFYQVRNKIIATYLLAGFLPLVLVLLLLWLGFQIFMVQLMSYSIRLQVDQKILSLEKACLQVAQRLFILNPAAIDAGKEVFTPAQERVALEKNFPGVNLTWYKLKAGRCTLMDNTLPGPPPIQPSSINQGETFPKEGVYLYSTDSTEYVAVVVKMHTSIDEFQYLLVTLPLKGKFVEQLEKELNVSLIFSHAFRTSKKKKKKKEGSFSVTFTSNSKSNEYGLSVDKLNSEMERWLRVRPKGINYFDSYILFAGAYPQLLPSAKELTVFGMIHAQYSETLSTFLQGAIPETEINVGHFIYWLLLIIGVFFAIVQLAALSVSVVLSRSITHTIHQLDHKAKAIAKGDFSTPIASGRKDQLGALSSAFDKMAQDLQHLLEQVKKTERMEHELRIAQQVQNTFFPKQLPSFPSFAIHGSCLPARMVSGDYFDFILQKQNCLDFFIGDISGKGISAALLMAASQTCLRVEATRKPLSPVKEIVRAFNNYLCEVTSSGKFSTFFYGRIVHHNDSFLLTYCNAGHLPPVLLREREKIELTSGGMVAGVMPNIDYEQETISLTPGDLLVTYTDGFTEVFDNKEEEFGEERLLELISSNRSIPPHQLFTKAVTVLQQWNGSEEQPDDMTMILISLSSSD